MWTSILWWINVVKTSKAFRGYARSYKAKIIDSKDLLIQWMARKPSIENILYEIKGFRY